MKAFALIGDMIDSRKIKNRQEIQDELNSQLTLLNQKFNQKIISSLTITLGDEFQGLFNDSESLFLCIDIISTYFNPLGVQFRFGIGYGDMKTKYNSYDSLGADGEPYWNAREAINEISSTKNANRIFEQLNFQSYETEIINSLLKLQGSLRNQWTATQNELIYQILLHDNYHSIDTEYLINQHDYTPQRISNLISRSSYRHYNETRISLIKFINKEVE